MLAPEIIKKLQDMVGGQGVRSVPNELAAHGYDVGREGRQIPWGMVFPSNAAQAAAVMVLASLKNLTILPQGTGTHRHLPCFLDRTLVLSTVSMNRILNLDRESLKVTLEAGVRLKTLQDVLDREGLYFPPYPWCFEGATVGGCAAEGIGGPASVRHGVFKQHVLGMEVVLPSGEVTRIGGETVKNVVGYDLTSLFCGSEGSLGLVASLTLRVAPKPPVERLLMVGFPSTSSAGASMDAITALGRAPERVSMLDPWMTRQMEALSSMKIPWVEGTTLLCQVSGLKEVVAAEAEAFLAQMAEKGGEVLSVVRDPAEIAELWHAQGRTLSALNEAAPSLLTWNMAVPRKKALIMMRRIEESARDCQLPMVHGGYYGNGVFHPAILMSENDHGQRKKGEAALGDLLSFALGQGGNGAGPFRQVGIETAKFRSPEDPHMSGLIQGIKKAIDPDGIMKPLSSFSGISKV